ncbi:MAG: glycosyltransferase [Verrucomicrobiota bacterium]
MIRNAGPAEVIVLDPSDEIEAKNRTLREADLETEVVVLLSTHTTAPEGWLEPCLALLNRQPEIGAVTPGLRTADDMGWDRAFLDRVEDPDRLEQGAWFYLEQTPCSALVVRGRVLKQTGPFDPLLAHGCEEIDLCRRIREAGFSIAVCPAARVFHFHGASTTTPQEETRRQQRLVRDRAILALRAAGRWRVLRLLQQGFMEFPRDLLGGMASSLLPVIAAKGYLSLLPLFPRLLWAGLDGWLWRRYLQRLGWKTGSVKPEKQLSGSGKTS